MNWGYKITLVILAFIFSMLFMVYIAFRQSNEMVDAHYYEKELKYQNYIDAAHKLNNVSTEALITQNESGLFIRIPKSLLSDFNNGKLEFIRNDDQKKDKALDFSPDPDGLFFIDKKQFSPGIYKTRINWSNGNDNYYREQDLNIVL